MGQADRCEVVSRSKIGRRQSRALRVIEGKPGLWVAHGTAQDAGQWVEKSVTHPGKGQ